MNFAFIITSYNPSNFVFYTIKSILNQTYNEFEIIYLDDNSDDNSLELLKTIDDKRLKIYKNSERKGLIYSLNYAISLTNCKYIIRFDSDDILLPMFLETRIANLNDDIVLLGENILITNKELKVVSKTNFPSQDKKIKNILLTLNNSINQPGVILKRESVLAAGGYNYVKAAEDYDLWIRMMKFGKFKNTKTYQVLYRVTGNSLTNKTFDDIPKTMIMALTNNNSRVFELLFVKVFLKLYSIYNNKRGFNIKKLFLFSFYKFYTYFLSFYLKIYKLKPAANASL
jgi:glycosyltransferase involved in cell wall biosynthesis